MQNDEHYSAGHLHFEMESVLHLLKRLSACAALHNPVGLLADQVFFGTEVYFKSLESRLLAKELYYTKSVSESTGK